MSAPDQDMALERQRRLSRAYATVFAGDDGELVLDDLLQRTGILAANVEGEITGMAYVEGRRSVGLEVLSELRYGRAELLAHIERQARDVPQQEEAGAER